MLASRYGVSVEPIVADLATGAGRERIEHAPTALDLLVNNAGLTVNTPFLRLTAANQTLLLSVNVHAVMRLRLAALQQMVQQRHGAVVNVSAVSGFGAAMRGDERQRVGRDVRRPVRSQSGGAVPWVCKN